MPFISKNDLEKIISLERDIAVFEAVSVINSSLQSSEEIAQIQEKKEKLQQLKMRFKLNEFEGVRITKVTESRSGNLNFKPSNLLDALIKHLNLRNDAALSRALEVAPPVISKIRHGRLPIGPTLLLAMHEVSDLSIKELRALMGDTQAKFGA